MGGQRDGEGHAYVAALLAKFPILIGWAQRWTMPMVCYCYLGCGLVLQLLGGRRGGQESNELQNGCFCRVSSLIPM